MLLRLCSVAVVSALAVIGVWTSPAVSADQPKLTVNDVVANEGNGGTKTFTFTITKNGSTSNTVSVNYSTTSPIGTESDFVSERGKVTFLPDEYEKNVGIEVIADDIPEGHDVFDLNLYGAEGASAGDAGHGYITNDDIELSIADMRYAETDEDYVIWFFTVTRRGANKDPITFDFATANGTASAPSDYNAKSGTTTIPYNTYLDTSEWVSVYVKGDTAPEEDETFFVNLNDVVGAELTDGSARGTIDDDDGSVPTANHPPTSTPTPPPRSTLPPPGHPLHDDSEPQAAASRTSADAAQSEDPDKSAAPDDRTGASTPTRSPGATAATASPVSSERSFAMAADEDDGSGGPPAWALGIAGLVLAGGGASLLVLARRRGIIPW